MKRKSILTIFVLLLSLALVVTGCGNSGKVQEQSQQEEPQGEQQGDGSWARVKEAGKLVVGLDDGYPPMGFRNDKGELVGFDIEMGEEIEKILGIELEWVPTDWNGVVAALKAKKFDVIISGMNMWEERKKEVNFAGPYGVAGQVILVKEDNNEDIQTLEDLQGKVIGTQLGSTGEKEARDAGFDEKTMKLYNKFPECFADLDNGRIEAVVIDAFAAPEWIKTGKYKRVGETLGVNDEAFIGIAVRKEDKELLDKLNEAIDTLLENGTLREISMKWIGHDITEGIK